MKNFSFVKNEHGVSALETAIILLAFLVVASIFAFTILTTGTFLVERQKSVTTVTPAQTVVGNRCLPGWDGDLRGLKIKVSDGYNFSLTYIDRSAEGERTIPVKKISEGPLNLADLIGGNCK